MGIKKRQSTSVTDVADQAKATLLLIASGLSPSAYSTLKATISQGHHVPRPEKPLCMTRRKMY